MNKENIWKCLYSKCSIAQEAHTRSYKQSSSSELLSTCMHISQVRQAAECNEENSILQLNPAVLDDFPFPKDVYSSLVNVISQNKANLLIRLVSQCSFAIQDIMMNESSESAAPLGIVHFRIDNNNKSFHCSCSNFRRSSSLASCTIAPKLTKRCSHFYIVLWAILSNEELHDSFYIGTCREEKGKKII